MQVELTEEEYELLNKLRESEENKVLKLNEMQRAKDFKTELTERIKEYGYDTSDNKFKYLYNYVRCSILVRAGLVNQVNGNRGMSKEVYSKMKETMDLMFPSKEE